MHDPLPFAPTLTAGATTDQAGGYTDFSMLLQRGDGQQRIEELQFKAPEGLLGDDLQGPAVRRTAGQRGDVPAASQIGHTVVGVGPGPVPVVHPAGRAAPRPDLSDGPV